MEDVMHRLQLSWAELPIKKCYWCPRRFFHTPAASQLVIPVSIYVTRRELIKGRQGQRLAELNRT